MDKQLNPATNQVKDRAVVIADQKKQKESQGYMVLIPGLTVWKYDLRNELCEKNVQRVEIKKEKGTVSLTILDHAENASTRFSLDVEDNVLYDQAINKKNAIKKFQRQIAAMEKYIEKHQLK